VTRRASGFRRARDRRLCLIDGVEDAVADADAFLAVFEIAVGNEYRRVEALEIEDEARRYSPYTM